MNTWIKKSKTRINQAIRRLLNNSSIIKVNKGMYRLTTKGLAEAQEIILKYAEISLMKMV